MIGQYGPDLTRLGKVALLSHRRRKMHLPEFCCEYAALRLLLAGSYSYSAGQVPEGFRRIRGLSGGLTQGRQVSFLCLYMTRLAFYFLR
jgi:hypothetical protein